MPIDILMPALSPTMTEGNLVKWLKAEGDKVTAGEILAEIETDKATMEVEAVDEGTLGKILVPAGTEEVKVNEIIAILLEDGEDASAIEAATANVASAPASAVEKTDATTAALAPISPASAPTASDETAIIGAPEDSARLFASPLARRLALAKGIALADVKGTGPMGRIVKADIENARAPAAIPSSAAKSTASPVASADFAEYTDHKLNGMRKTIAKRLSEAKQTIPHFYLTIDCRLDELLKLRGGLNGQANLKAKFSVNDFVIRAVALALMDAPKANVTYHGDYVRRHTAADVCVAVAVDDGLVTPVIKAANLKSLTEISLEIKDLAERARSGKLAPEAYRGGSFTVSNLGMFGVKNFDAIVNPPQACILAVGAGEKRAIAIDDEIKVANMVSCTLSIDHRALDGAAGAEFLRAFKTRVENPLGLLS